MKTCYLLAIAVTLATAPYAWAHVDGGTYGFAKSYCEDMAGDQRIHDYSPGTGSALFFPSDGSFPPCPYDSFWDGHYEFAYGGAWLLSCDSFCYNSLSGTTGSGSLVCWGTYADHPTPPPIAVFDHFLTFHFGVVTFTVAGDYFDNTPDDDPEECGDFEADFSADCVNACTPAFGPGLDGSYEVFVQGTWGHVSG